MAIEFSILHDKRAVLIEAGGDIEGSQVEQLRRRAAEIIGETGYTDFIIDFRNVTSLEQGKVGRIVELGEKFSDSRITVWSNTAMLMPSDEAAFRQVELMHTIQINRGRGVLSYVESHDEAFSWFEDMASRI